MEDKDWPIPVIEILPLSISQGFCGVGAPIVRDVRICECEIIRSVTGKKNKRATKKTLLLSLGEI